ncbi:unnamed protein product [Pieris macdunnoughi]|uniref:Uncharacterized protein n=1 Tax=Pieris macdunnoughi TaxID=345717 RepID=A0A821TCI5_9NEOP|nr:unnamed protein product [Pieris macdunnoughi]
MTNTPMRLVSLQLRVLILLLPQEHTNHILGDYGEQDAVLPKKRSPVYPRTVHGQERPYKYCGNGVFLRPATLRSGPRQTCILCAWRALFRKMCSLNTSDAVLVHVTNVGTCTSSNFDDEYPDDVGEPSAACTDPSASSRTHEPHIGDHVEQDAVLPKKRSPVHPRTVHGQERPYKYVCKCVPCWLKRTANVVRSWCVPEASNLKKRASADVHRVRVAGAVPEDVFFEHIRRSPGSHFDDEYPVDVGEPSAACTDPSASSRTHEPHIGDHVEQDAVLPKKRSPVHPRTVHGQERPYKYCVPCWLKGTANVVRSWCVPEASNLEKRASADVHPVRVAGAVPEDVFFEHISGAVLVHIANEGTFTSSNMRMCCDDEYPDDVGEPSAACTDPSASSRTHEPHIGDHVEQDAVLPKKRSPVYPRTVHGQERPYKYVWTANVVRSWCVPEASNLEKRASADVHPVRVAGAVPEDVFFEHISGAVLVHIANERTFTSSNCDDEYSDEVGEPSAACTDPSASSRTHEPHIGDHVEQDAVLPKKRSPVYPRTVHGQERPYKYVCCDDEYPDDVGEPSAACTDPSASSRTHEPHIGDHVEQDAVLPKKRSPVHPRTVHGQERPYKYVCKCVPCWLKRTANVVRSWCVPETSNLKKRASADVHRVRVAGAVPEDVFFEHISGAVLVHIANEGTFPSSSCDDEYPDDVGEPSAACTDPSASSRTHEPHIGDHVEQDAVLPKKRSPVYPRTVHGQERPYKNWVPCWLKGTANVVRSWCVPEASNLEKRASADVHPVRVAGAVPEDVFFEHISGAVLVHIANEGTFPSSNCDDEYPDDVGEPSAACTDLSSSSRTHEPHIGDHVEQDAVLPKKRSPVHPRTVHGQERPYKYVCCDDEYPDDVGEPSAACTDPSASSRTHEPHIGDHVEQDAVLPKKRSPVHSRTVHGQERPYCDDEYPDDVGEPSAACTDLSASSRTHEPHIGDYGEQDAVLLKKRSPVHPRTVHGQERPYKNHSGWFRSLPAFYKRKASVCHRLCCCSDDDKKGGWCRGRILPVPDCDDEYSDEVGEPSAACTDPSASSRTHEPHIGDYGEQDAVLPKKRSPVYPRTVHGQERPYKYVYFDDEYPDDVGEPSAACTDPSASSRSHEPHIGDHVEQDAVLPKKRSPVHPRTVHGQERPYKYVCKCVPCWLKRTANVVRSWCVPEASNLKKRASADVHRVRVAGAVPEDVIFEHISGAVLVHIANEGTFTSSNMRMYCDDEYPDEVGEPSAACTDPSASSRTHELHIGDYGEQDAVLLKKRSPVHPRTVHGQERPYKNHSGWFRSPPAFYKRKASVCHRLCCCSDDDKKGGWCRGRILPVPDCDDEYPDDVGEPSAACTDPSASSRTHEPHIGDHGEQDAVLPKKRSPVHPRTVHGQERPYKYVYCDDEYPDEVGEPSAACTDPSASSRTHELHIGDYGEQDAVLLKKRSPVHPRTVHGQDRPYKNHSGWFRSPPAFYKRKASVCHGLCCCSDVEDKKGGCARDMLACVWCEASVCLAGRNGLPMWSGHSVFLRPVPDCDDEYPDEVGEPSAACTDPSASSRTHELHIGDYGEQDAVLLKKRSPVHPRTVHGQDRPYKNHSGWFRSPPAFYKRKASVCHGLCCCSDVDKKGGWCRRRIL